MTTVPDTIERTITIDAPAESVWSLVSEPGWWINTGAITEHTITWDGDVAAVTDPTHGTFHIRRIEVREPEYIAWRWAAGGSEEGEQVLDTLCEFHIRPLAKGWRCASSSPAGPASRTPPSSGATTRTMSRAGPPRWPRSSAP